MFFSIVYISGSLVLGAVFNIMSVNILSILYLPPILTLSVSLLLAFKVPFDLDSVVIELGFILKAVYYYSPMG